MPRWLRTTPGHWWELEWRVRSRPRRRDRSGRWQPCRPVMVSGGADGMVRLIDPGSGETVLSLPGHAGPVRSLAVIPAEGSGGFGVLASGGVDGIVRIWSLGDYELQHEVRFLDGEVWALVPL